ncbi:MAG: bifunctional isocitrate dehydrogenase kinase/phosphatase [Planctomycetes bacterium]|nr:bifunctional isocitrate dehydrogenase kinase/phosphatase [Planctomycetota bacterium]
MAGESIDHAAECAARLRRDFVAYDDAFRAVTRRARARFEARDWEGSRRDAVERIELYDTHVDRSVVALRSALGPLHRDHALWREIKGMFAVMVLEETDIEFFKTYFSSVSRRIFDTDGADPLIEFTGIETTPLRNPGPPAACRSYVDRGSLERVFAALLADYAWSVPHTDPQADARRLADAVREHYRCHQDSDTVLCIEVLEAVFYRDTRAYLLGRCTGWNRSTPLVIAFEHSESGIAVEAVAQTQKELSALFGYARSYFHVDLDSVGAAIQFLRELLPRKPLSELFTVLGRAKQGKTERIRDLMAHLAWAKDEFIAAPGARGMVMCVFTLPSYDVVFKVIRDEFDYPKNATREAVEQRYALVFKHDRGGRLVDAQEFRQLKFHRDCFAPELLDELLAATSRTTRLVGEHVVIGHAYVERRLRPLDMYLREVEGPAARLAVLDYGQAIRDLAATNIFPGDLLPKNFGMSRHGRAIFYDYDELCLLTDCRFRDKPEPRSHEEEMSAEPWYHVGEQDVFPEEFLAFLGLDECHAASFVEAHGELLTARYWRGIQERIRAGEVLEVTPFG